jgi:anti-anti-sigma factor
MDIAVTTFEHWQIVSLQGKFVTQAIDSVRKLFTKFEKLNILHVAVDLSQTTHMDSTAISCLVTFYKRISVKNGKIVLFGANNDITGIIHIVGLDHAFPFYKTKSDFKQSIQINASN